MQARGLLQGSVLYLPGSKDSLCVTDMPAYAQLLSTFLQTKAPCSEHLPCLGDAKTAFWDRAAVEEFLKKQNSDVQVRFYIGLPLQISICLRPFSVS